MIQVVNFGSQAGGSGTSESYHAEEEGKKQDNSKAGNIPKLAEAHRLDVLPIVIKILLSKLIKKKGAINQKTVHVRRTIIYSFMSQLNSDTELRLFFNELLSTFDIEIDDELLIQDQPLNESDLNRLRERLSQASFSNFLNFIGSFSVIIKQMGSLLVSNGYLQRITMVFVQILSLTKRFIKHLKLSIAEDKLTPGSAIKLDSDNEEVEMPKTEGGVEVKDALYRFVGHQSKVCMRKGLAIVKQLYEKYSNVPAYITDFSRQVYTELISDQLVLLNTNVSYLFLTEFDYSLSLIDLNFLKS